MRSFSKLFCWRSAGGGGRVDDRKKPITRSRDITINKGVVTYLACGLLSLMLGCLSFIWPPRDIILTERLRMRRGLPPFDWWLDTPDLVLMRVFLFNITNAEQFLSGSHTKLQFEEIGPIVFREALRHTNIRRHDNGTMTYTSQREPIFAPELNTINLNDTIMVPNLAYLGMTSFLSETSFIVKFGLNVLASRLNTKPIQTISVHDYLMNNSDPLLSLGAKFIPTIVPVTNLGIIDMIYKNFVHNVTVHIGTKKPRKFFTMNQYDGNPRFNYWPNSTCDSVESATEGILYHQDIYRNDSLQFFRKTLCRITPIKYAADDVRAGLGAYRFTLPLDTFDRPKNGSYDCYTLPGTKPMPDGVSDISPCFFNFPMAISFPHFLGADKVVQDSVMGLNPSMDIHESYAIVEPSTGIPLESRASIQGNLVMGNVNDFRRVGPFSNMFIPIFWLQLHQTGIPDYMATLIYIVVELFPRFQGFGSAFLVVLGSTLLIIGVFRFQRKAAKVVYNYISLDQMPQQA